LPLRSVRRDKVNRLSRKVNLFSHRVRRLCHGVNLSMPVFRPKTQLSAFFRYFFSLRGQKSRSFCSAGAFLAFDAFLKVTFLFPRYRAPIFPHEFGRGDKNSKEIQLNNGNFPNFLSRFGAYPLGLPLLGIIAVKSISSIGSGIS